MRKKNTHQKLKMRVYQRDGFRCQLGLSKKCLGDMSERREKYLAGRMTRVKAGYSVDHKRPVSRGGRWEMGNLVCACMPCNLAKGSEVHGEEDRE